MTKKRSTFPSNIVRVFIPVVQEPYDRANYRMIGYDIKRPEENTEETKMEEPQNV